MEVILLDPLGNHAGRDVRTVANVAEAAEWIAGSVAIEACG